MIAKDRLSLKGITDNVSAIGESVSELTNESVGNIDSSIDKLGENLNKEGLVDLAQKVTNLGLVDDIFSIICDPTNSLNKNNLGNIDRNLNTYNTDLCKKFKNNNQIDINLLRKNPTEAIEDVVTNGSDVINDIVDKEINNQITKLGLPNVIDCIKDNAIKGLSNSINFNNMPLKDKLELLDTLKNKCPKMSDPTEGVSDYVTSLLLDKMSLENDSNMFIGYMNKLATSKGKQYVADRLADSINSPSDKGILNKLVGLSVLGKKTLKSSTEYAINSINSLSIDKNPSKDFDKIDGGLNKIDTMWSKNAHMAKSTYMNTISSSKIKRSGIQNIDEDEFAIEMSNSLKVKLNNISYA